MSLAVGPSTARNNSDLPGPLTEIGGGAGGGVGSGDPPAWILPLLPLGWVPEGDAGPPLLNTFASGLIGVGDDEARQGIWAQLSAGCR